METLTPDMIYKARSKMEIARKKKQRAKNKLMKQKVKQQQLDDITTSTGALISKTPVPIATEQKTDVIGNDILKNQPTKTFEHNHVDTVRNNISGGSNTSSGRRYLQKLRLKVHLKLEPALAKSEIEQLLKDWPTLTCPAIHAPFDSHEEEKIDRDRLQEIFSESQLDLILEPFVWKPKFVLLAVASSYVSDDKLIKEVAEMWDRWAGFDSGEDDSGEDEDDESSSLDQELLQEFEDLEYAATINERFNLLDFFRNQ
jgi:hypothetical protein